jgi:hypothetical protein
MSDGFTDRELNRIYRGGPSVSDIALSQWNSQPQFNREEIEAAEASEAKLRAWHEAHPRERQRTFEERKEEALAWREQFQTEQEKQNIPAEFRFKLPPGKPCEECGEPLPFGHAPNQRLHRRCKMRAAQRRHRAKKGAKNLPKG